MSRFRNEVAHLQAHVKTLRMAGAALFVLAAFTVLLHLGVGRLARFLSHRAGASDRV